MANSIVKSQENKVAASTGKTMKDYIKSMEGEIAKALPSVITPERFTRMVLSALSTDPKLGTCTPASFLGAMMSAAQLGLEPNTPLGQAYILPYSDHGVMKAQFQLGYKGLIDLAYRSGEVVLVQAHVVFENDDFEWEYGLEPKLTHKPASGDRGKATHVYAMFKTKSGEYGFEVMSMEDINLHAMKYSKSYSSAFSPWKTSFNEMAKKTVLKDVLKYAPLKSDFVRDMSADGTIKTTISDDMYSEPAETVIDAQDAEYTDVQTDENGEVTDDEQK